MVPDCCKELGWQLHFPVGNTSLTRSLLTEADAGHTEFTDEVYQNESRYPGGEWKPAEDAYTDAVSSLLPAQRLTRQLFGPVICESTNHRHGFSFSSVPSHVANNLVSVTEATQVHLSLFPIEKTWGLFY